MRNLKDQNVCLGGGAEPKNSLFKPLVATSLALALGVNVGMAQTIGGNDPTGNGSATGNKYFVVTTGANVGNLNVPGTIKAGTSPIDVLWDGSGNLADNGNNTGVDNDDKIGSTIQAKNVIVKLGENGGGFIGGSGNWSAVTLTFDTSTLIGNIISTQKWGSYTFNGNGTYNDNDSNGVTYALVGNIKGENSSNVVVNFNNSANMKGMIYGHGGSVTATFSGGNTLVGSIGNTGAIEGTTNVNFNNNATLKGNGNNTIISAIAVGGTTSVNVNFGTTLTSGQTANTTAQLLGDIIAGNKTKYNAGTATNNITFNTSMQTITIGNSGGSNQILARMAGMNTLTFNAGTATIYSNVVAGADGYGAERELGRNVFNFNNASVGNFNGSIQATTNNSRNVMIFADTSSGTFTGDISATGSALNYIVNNGTKALTIKNNTIGSNTNGKTYIINNSSGTLKVGDTSEKTIIDLNYDGGGTGSGIYITDYNSSANETDAKSGFWKDANGISSGEVNLNLSTLKFNRGTGDANTSSTALGQTFVLDTYQGSANIDSLSYSWYGHTNIIRFRKTIGTSITLGTEQANSNLITSGGKATTLFQAADITIHGGVATTKGTATLTGAANIVIDKGVSTVSGLTSIYGGAVSIGEGISTSSSGTTEIMTPSLSLKQDISLESYGKTYLMLLKSDRSVYNTDQTFTITTAQSSKANLPLNISVTGAGGASGARMYITDYDSKSLNDLEANKDSTIGGFDRDGTAINANSARGNTTLNIGSLTLNNGTSGQSFVFDFYKGSVSVASHAIGGNQSLIMRLRSTTDNTSIAFTNSLSTSGSNGYTLLQAKDITISGGTLSTYLGVTEIIAGNTASTLKVDNITSDQSGKTYIMQTNNGGSLGIAGANGSDPVALSVLGTGGTNDARLYITDYDSKTNDTADLLDSDPQGILTNANGTLKTLNISTLSFNNGSTGQKSYIDFYDGSVVIDSRTASNSIFMGSSNSVNVIRFRNTSSADSSITIGREGGVASGGVKVLNGNVSTNGSKAQTLFQARNIKIYGSMTTSGGGTTNLTAFDTLRIAGTLSNNGQVTASANTLTIENNIETYGGTTKISAKNDIDVSSGEIYTIKGSLTITGTGTNGVNSLSTKAIYGNGIYDNNGTFNLEFNNGGSLSTAIIAGNKNDAPGGATYINNITIDNSSTTSGTQNVLISVIDASSSNSLKVIGGTLSGLTLKNNGVAGRTNGRLILDGNVAIFANTNTTKNTINVKSNDYSTAHIVGDIVTIAGTNTISLSDSGTNGQTPAIIGNIQTNNGNTNISLENALWAPSSLASMPTGSGNQALLKSYVETYGTGEITTNGGKTTVVSRLARDLVGSLDDTDPLVFKVNANGGESNIIMQINSATTLNTQAIINYANGVTNMVFANSNDGASSGDGSVVGGTGTNGTAPTESFDANDTDSSANKFFGLTYQDGVKFKLENKVVKFGNESVSLVDKYGKYFRTLNDNGDILTITSKRTTDTDTGVFTGLAMGEITSLSSSTGGKNTKTYNNTLSAGSAFVGNINLTSGASATLQMEKNTKLILTGDKATIATLTLSGGQNTFDHNQLQLETLDQTNNRIINLATNGGSASAVSTRENFRLLEIGSNGTKTTGLLGDSKETIVFTNYVNANAGANATLGGESVNTSQSGYAYADRIVIHNVGDGTANSTKTDGSVYMQFAVDANTNLGSIKYNDTLNNGKGGTAVEGNVAVLTVANSANGGADNALIKLKTQDTLQGFDVLSGTIKGVATDANGMTNATSDTAAGDYTTYFLTSLSTTGADSAIQDATASAFATSLDIFMANFNSLNKRMGELRDNNNSQGAWARVFGGSQSSSFGLGSKTDYVTTQAGYDYAFGFEGANNYLGVAVAYGYSSSSTSNATNTLNGVSEGIEGDLKSNMVEVALYNSYVQDSGWYNDSIFKFNYIMNSFSTSGTAMGNNVDTNTFGIILSDEFGYRFKLGSENEWYIDPQAEFSFGYVNGTEYTLVSGYSTLQAKSDSMMQLRSRFGSSFGYDFKKFTANKPIKASVYVGAFYEYDYLSGGDVTLTTNLGGVNSIQSSLASDGRVVMNVGTNMTIKDNTRIYFDFESSFAGKINTDYQVNVGVRYSFGENTGYTPMTAKKEVAPLKISEEKTEESKEVENTENKTEENKAQ